MRSSFARKYLTLAGLVCLTLLAGCTLPAAETPTAAPFPMPNETLTALFASPPAATQDFTAAPPRLITATPGAVSATPVPSTAVPPTGTPLPATATNTRVPATLAPTTVPPTQTATPDLRGLVVQAGRLSTPPALDGGWTDLPEKEYPIAYLVYGNANWTGKDDLTASFRVGWDSKYLYLGVKIHDDVYAQHAAGANLYKGDSLDVMIDTDLLGDFLSTQAGSDDYQLGISPGRPNVSGTREAYLWQPAAVAGARSQVKIASLRDESQHLTRVEVAIPWSMLGVTPQAGLRLGFTLSVSDNDHLSSDIQKSMISTARNRELFNPTTWGELVLK
jgi:hypothetical protein